MNSLPVSCHNCYSDKREFYVFLQCKHFICLSCCLFMANLQTLTVRCCHRNTKMSQELVQTIYEEIRQRKILKEKGEIFPQSLSTDLNVHLDKSLLQNRREEIQNKIEKIMKKEENMKKQQNMRKEEQQQVFHRTRDQDFIESKLVKSLKKTKQVKDELRQLENGNKKHSKKKYDMKYSEHQSKHTYPQYQSKHTYPRYESKHVYPQYQKDRLPVYKEKDRYLDNSLYDKQKKSVNYMNTAPQVGGVQYQSPTFKNIVMKTQVKEPLVRFNEEQTKENFQYWKNYDTTKDRILAKLNHHQLKMKTLIKQHYN